MQFPLLRAAALVIVGNAALAGREVSAFAGSSLFRFSKEVEFVVPLGAEKYEQVAADPLAWFAWLKARRCRGLRMHRAPMEEKPGRPGHIEERMLVGFVGGGPRWLIEAVGEGVSDVWEGYDRVGDRDEVGRIWLTAYVRLGEMPPEDDVDADVAGAAAGLGAALDDIIVLAGKFQSAPFDGLFKQAKATLDGLAPKQPPPDFEALADLGAAARRLLAAAQTAWVFGGMGSWNDTGPDAELAPEYERTSEALFQAIVRAMRVVANSTYAG